LANVKKIFSSETAGPNGAKLGIDGPWVCPFQNCVRQPHPPFKMAAQPERTSNFICNLWLYTLIPKIKSISPSIAKKSGNK
jgi:hypothetical protein